MNWFYIRYGKIPGENPKGKTVFLRLLFLSTKGEEETFAVIFSKGYFQSRKAFQKKRNQKILKKKKR